MTPARLILWAGLLAFAVDQATKIGVIRGMSLVERQVIEVLPPLLTFRYGENRGINFGLFDDGGAFSRWFLVVLALAVCAVLLIWLFRAARPRLMLISSGLLIGGALGNVLDRVLYGFVLDFLNMSCCGINNPFVFNLADVFIFAGAIGLVLFDKPADRQKLS